MQFDRQTTVVSPSGAEVNLYVALPKNPARAVVQINHGVAEHAARYARFARLLTDHGYAVYAHDHRGHGYTRAPDAPLGSFGREPAKDKVIADVVAIHNLIEDEHPGAPVIIFGHSMGSLITLNFVLEHSKRVAGVAFWNGNVTAGLPGRAAQALLAWERFRLGSDVPSRVLPKLTFDAWSRRETDGRTSFDWLSHNHSEVDAYVADPLCGWNASVGMWRVIFELIFAGANDRNFASIHRDLPFNLVGGAGDQATDCGKAVEHLATRLRAMGFSNLVSTIYADTRHESLNELNRDLIAHDFVRWADLVVQAHAGDAKSS